MSGFLRKLWPPVAAFAAIVVAVMELPFAAALAVMALVCLVSVARLKTPFLRNASLMAAAFLLGIAGVEFALYLLEPPRFDDGVIRTPPPPKLYVEDPVVHYRPKPDMVASVKATSKDQTLYDVKYTVLPSGDRAVPGSADQGPTYLFLGDSVPFGEGVNDSETTSSQFAQLLKPPAHVVNLGVGGWGPTHMVRAMETGLFDKYVVGKVAAVIVWVAPPSLDRVTGDTPWLAKAPRYDYGADGKLHYTSSFEEYRGTHPLAALGYLARTHSRIVRRILSDSQESEQGRLYADLMARLQEMVRERYGAPLILLSNGPEASVPDQPDPNHFAAFDKLRKIGAPEISVRKLLGPRSTWGRYFISHDGHPTPLLHRMMAEALIKYFAKADHSN